MAWVAVSVAAISTGASLISNNSRNNGIKDAARTSAEASDAAVDEQRRQFDELQELFRPFVEGGTSAFGNQLSLIGVNGRDAQEEAINAIRTGSEYKTLLKEGENAMLQNASATGGLRGGNTMKALSEFRPQLLNSLINNQFDRLGGLAQMGQASAARQAAAGQNSANNISEILMTAGDNAANAEIARGNNQAGLISDLAGGIGGFIGKKF